MTDTMGMMNAAYAISRTEILKWINSTLSLNLEKVEELGTGAVYCQLLDSIYPKTIPLKKVKWRAINYNDKMHNFKILQNGFKKNQHKKFIEVEKLMKCKYQDNLEMAQWMKAVFDNKGGNTRDYDAIARRGNANLDGFFGMGKSKPGASSKRVVKKNSSKFQTASSRTSVSMKPQVPARRSTLPDPTKRTVKMVLKDVKSILQSYNSLINPLETIQSLHKLLNITPESRPEDLAETAQPLEAPEENLKEADGEEPPAEFPEPSEGQGEGESPGNPGETGEFNLLADTTNNQPNLGGNLAGTKSSGAMEEEAIPGKENNVAAEIICD